jgi:NADH:ubiquinone oxidoreductase subunit 3 (subunit A)
MYILVTMYFVQLDFTVLYLVSWCATITADLSASCLHNILVAYEGYITRVMSPSQ